MKKFLKLPAICLVFVMLATIFAGCHDKDEIAFTIDGQQFTTAMYSCVLYISGSNARNKISTYVSENDGDTKDIKYKSYKFDDEGNVSDDGTPYETYVRNEAIKVLKQYAVLNNLMAEKGLELDDDLINEARVQAQYYWHAGCDYSTYSSYAAYGMDPSQYFTPYSESFEPNGVALSTYEQYMINEYVYNYYFEHLYGEDGEQEIPADELTSYLTGHYVIADTITFSKTDSDGKALSDEAIAELKKQADGYAERLNAGEEFDAIYEEYNAADDEEKTDDTTSSEETSSEDTSSEDTSSGDTSSDSASSGDEKEDEYTPPSYTGLYGDEETSYASDLYEDVSKLETGVAAVIDDGENSQYVLVVRRDITEKDYWLNALRETIMYAMKQDEYDGMLNEKAGSLTVEEDTYATGRFDVEDIKF